MANVPVKQLEGFVMSLLEIENVRDIRLATKGLMGIPQHFLQDDVKEAFERMRTARDRDVDIALHTHVNCAQQVTRSLAMRRAWCSTRASATCVTRGAAAGREHVARRPAGAMFHAPHRAKIMPYYFYMCDMIPNAEHWRTSVAEAQDLQYRLLGYMPGFATPRVICDVPFVREALGAC